MQHISCDKSCGQYRGHVRCAGLYAVAECGNSFSIEEVYAAKHPDDGRNADHSILRDSRRSGAQGVLARDEH